MELRLIYSNLKYRIMQFIIGQSGLLAMQDFDEEYPFKRADLSPEFIGNTNGTAYGEQVQFCKSGLLP